MEAPAAAPEALAVALDAAAEVPVVAEAGAVVAEVGLSRKSERLQKIRRKLEYWKRVEPCWMYNKVPELKGSCPTSKREYMAFVTKLS